MITIENADKALKDYYLQAVSAQLNENVSPFFTAIEKSAENVTGKDVKISLVRSGVNSVFALAEDADLPNPHKNRYFDITMPLKNIYGTIEVSDKALRASRESSGAFVNLVNAEMDGLISGAKYNFKRMLYGDGDGTLCKITEIDGEDKTLIAVDDAKDWFTGLRVDLITSGGEAQYSDITVVSVNVAENKVKVSQTLDGSLADGKMAIHGGKGNELTGLGAIFGADTLYGYSKAEEPYFKPYEVTLDSPENFKEENLTDIVDYLEEHFNSKVNMILCSFATRKKIAALIAENKRVVNTIDANTGVGEVTVNGIPVYADRFCPDKTVYFINTEDFVLCQLCDWEWLEDEDGKILKQSAGKAAYGATLVKYAELICKKPCGQAVLKNI